MNTAAETGAVVALSDAAWCRRAEQALRDDGQRLTAPRRAILTWIAAQPAPFTAEALVAALASAHGSAGRATVYRTVEWLRVSGWIARVNCDSGEATYARLLPGHYHHAVCIRCKKTLIVAGCAIVELLAAPLACQGFEVTNHVLEIYGLCKNCRPTAQETLNFSPPIRCN